MVSLDNHPFQVITSDFVPIKPYYADWIFLGIGQRYDVVINANQTSGNCKQNGRDVCFGLGSHVLTSI